MIIKTSIDNTIHFFADPFNAKFSNRTRIVVAVGAIAALALFELRALTTLVVIHGVCLLRRLQFQDTNKTYERVVNLFKRKVPQPTTPSTSAPISKPTQSTTSNPPSPTPPQKTPTPSQPNPTKPIDKSTPIHAVYQENPTVKGNPIEIKVVRSSVSEQPQQHLKKFSDVLEIRMKTDSRPPIKVTFLNADKTEQEGIDAAGLTRDYLDDLFASLTNNKTLFKQMMPSCLLIPHKNMGEPLTDEERSTYQQLGRIMMFCFLSDDTMFSSYTIGRHFDEALFKAALCLNSTELKTPFDKLSVESLKKICLSLSQAMAEADPSNQAIKLAEFVANKDLYTKEILDIANLALISENLDMKYQTDGQPDINKIGTNMNQFVKSMYAYMLAQFEFDSKMAPIHAVAQGMQSVCSTYGENETIWDTGFVDFSFHVVSNKIQGAVSRDEIANQIILSPHLDDKEIELLPEVDKTTGIRLRDNAKAVKAEISKKVGWLQDWIRKEATDEEVKKFLKFSTASSSFPRRREITVREQNHSKSSSCVPFIVAHTCTFELEIAPIPTKMMAPDETGTKYKEYRDDTRANFIEGLRYVSLKDPSKYSNQ